MGGRGTGVETGVGVGVAVGAGLGVAVGKGVAVGNTVAVAVGAGVGLCVGAGATVACGTLASKFAGLVVAQAAITRHSASGRQRRPAQAKAGCGFNGGSSFKGVLFCRLSPILYRRCTEQRRAGHAPIRLYVHRLCVERRIFVF